MKKYLLSIKKQVSMLLILTMIFSLFSGVIVVNAAPQVLSIIFERERSKTLTVSEERNSITITGSGFSNPMVMADGILLNVNSNLSNTNIITIDDPRSLNRLIGNNSRIVILNDGEEVITGESGIMLDLSNIPTIESTQSKVFVGEPLTITGFFEGIDAGKDKLFIAGTPYDFDGVNVKISDDKTKVTISSVRPPNNTGISDVRIVRKETGDSRSQIASTLKDSITVVDRLSGISVDRIDPNIGAKQRENMVNIYGTFPGNAGDFRVFINSSDGPEGKNLGLITDLTGKIIGLSVKLPQYPIGGAASIVLTNERKSSEYEVPNKFIYLDIGNILTIEDDGISPRELKESQEADVTILGRNIGYFDGSGYDKLSGVVPAEEHLVGYKAVPGFGDTTSYKVQYKGIYDNNKSVIIMRQINVFIDGAALITGAPTFKKEKDTIVVRPSGVTLDPKEPKKVDVTIKTTTTVYEEGNTGIIYFSRAEECTEDEGFTFIPNETIPAVTGITPTFGPNDKDILVTIKGSNFEVSEDGTAPEVKIGTQLIKGKDEDGNNLVKVYDSQNKPVDGKIIKLGTKMTFTLPAGSGHSGAVNVVVKNPSDGQCTVTNGFTFKNPDANRLMPVIKSIKEPFADTRGGQETGETILITGENFDPSLESDHRVTITIGGEKANIVGTVSADGKSVTVVPPPAIAPGWTKLQLINEDGSMAEKDFEYRRAVTNPKITKITPLRGGKGTKLVIKGEDFLLPDLSTNNDDPRHKGTVVLLGGKELNAYRYDEGGITNDGSDIYYNNGELDGEMVKVQDGTTIYVDIPDKFYSFDPAAAANDYLKASDIPLGDLKVEVLNPDGTKSKENITFTYVKPATFPTISDITPDSGSINGGTIITISGSNFKQDNLQVYFASEAAKEIQFINSSLLRVKVPIYPYDLPEDVDKLNVPVMVMNYDGGADVEENGFEYRIPGSDPAITSLSPSKGSAAGNEQVIIRGRDFRRDPSDENGVPKVYFNGIQAEVQWLGTGTDNVSELLLVTTPPSKIGGAVDVVVVNYDSGSYTYKSFSYEVSRPVINAVTPSSISKNGGSKVQINGTGFKKSNLSGMFKLEANTLPSGSKPAADSGGSLVYTEQIRRHTDTPIDAGKVIDSIVAFGDTTTGDKKVIDTVVGLKYTELYDIGVECTSVGAGSAAIKLYKAGDASRTAIRPELTIPFGSSHLFIVNGPEDLGDDTIGDEGVLVEATPNQIIVTRRISTNAKWENDGLQVTAVAPAIGGIGSRKLYVLNADGGTGSYNINVLNPASSPTIKHISPRNKVKRNGTIDNYESEHEDDEEYYTYTPLKGGAFVTINGTDFRKNVKVYLDNKELEILSRSLNDDQLVVKIPSGTEDDLDRLYRILVVNEDGGSADSSTLSKPHYIVYKLPQSSPIIENVVPGFTSSKGQNTIRIIGDDFREGAKVYIDGVQSSSVTLISYKELAVRVPLGLTPGKKLIQVMNPDYGFGEKKDALTIISSPEIEEVYDIDKDKELSPVLLSVEGGQNIRLEGKDFLNGVKVIIGGTLKLKKELKQGESGISCYNIKDVEMVIVGGTQAANVKVENSGTLTFTTPKLNVGKYNIIVVNSDGGVSNEVDSDFQKPKPDVPSGLEAEAVDSDTIKLEWKKIPETRYYEIYAAYSSSGKANNNYVYVGSVQAYEVEEGRLRFFVDGLKASSWYSFRLKSVNAYGPSDMSYGTGFIKTKDKKITSYYESEGDYISGIAQEGKITTVGNVFTYTAGEKTFNVYGNSFAVNLNQAEYSKYNPKNIDISIYLLKRYSNTPVMINEKDFTLRMAGRTIYVTEARAVPTAKLTDSKMTLSINKELKARGDEIRTKVPTGYKAVTAPAALNVTLQIEQDKKVIKSLNGSADIEYKITADIIRRYPGGIYVAYYNSTTKKLELLSTTVSSSLAKAQISKAGEYILIGKYTR